MQMVHCSGEDFVTAVELLLNCLILSPARLSFDKEVNKKRLVITVKLV